MARTAAVLPPRDEVVMETRVETTAPRRFDRFSGRSVYIAVIALFILAAVVRIGLIPRSGLWADELFSLAMATGHSLEHKADIADASKGDYIETHDAVAPDVYRQYLRHDSPPAPVSRVVRAVYHSDTSPPLYYVLLYGWTRAFGTSDWALRMFSVTAAMACFPLIWLIARQLAGTRGALAACTIYTFCPPAVYYAVEGRMYSLLWFFTLCSMAATLRLWRRGTDFKSLAVWTLAAAAGLLTHYFFAFVLAALGAGLMLMPRRASRWKVIVAAFVVALLVMPWFSQIPATLKHWRVTDYWLNLRPGGFNRIKSVLFLPWSFFSLRGEWGTRMRYEYLNYAVFAALALFAAVKLRRPLLTPTRLMLAGCVLAACAGLVVFDLWRKTYSVDCPRYAFAGFPAAVLLVGVVVARLPKFPRNAFLVAIVLVGCTGISTMYRAGFRNHPMRYAAKMISDEAHADDLVIVSSIPSGVSGFARYCQFTPGDEPAMAGWTVQLGQRTVPDDLLRLAKGRKRIILVRVHEVWADQEHEPWLAKNELVAKKSFWRGPIKFCFFKPAEGERF
jgi:hypothetical protein